MAPKRTRLYGSPDTTYLGILYRRHIPYVIYKVPLVLGYGLTVHRAQGLTLDAVAFQLNGLFAAGQRFTVLSRVRDYSRRLQPAEDPD